MRRRKAGQRKSSLYIKWGTRFVVLIMLAQMISYSIVWFSILPRVKKVLGENLEPAKEIAQNINWKGQDSRLDMGPIIFIDALKNAMFISAAVGSVFIVIGLVSIVLPIKRVTRAAREIADGNFDVTLESVTTDEIGQLIDTFNVMAAELQKTDYLRKDFVSNVSHEFKTPITSIEGFAKMLKSKELTPKQFEEYTDIIIKESDRLSTLSSNLLKLSMLEYSGFEPTKAVFSLDEQIRGVILLLQNRWEEKNIEFDIDMEETEISSNEELLSQVWINLIQNAIKFSRENGVIYIGLKRDNRNITVTVSDNGAGISPQDMERVFERFYKADKSRSEKGNGLGLSIVKKIVEILNGKVTLESELGKGTVFTVTLPEGDIG